MADRLIIAFEALSTQTSHHNPLRAQAWNSHVATKKSSKFGWIIALSVVGASLLPIGLSGCVTPPEIKQSLTSLDDAYAANSKLMQQYRDLMSTINSRELYWYQYIVSRARLDLALRWATTDPKCPSTPQKPITQGECVELAVQLLGKDVVALVNSMRLNNLVAQKDASGQDGFVDGKSTLEDLIQKIPSLVSLIATYVQEETKAFSPDTAAYDEYEKNIAILRAINASIKRYLDIDVTINPSDVKEIAAAVKKLQ